MADRAASVAGAAFAVAAVPEPVHIRAFRTGDEAALRDVFFSSVHTVACRNYTAVQLAAWAPVTYDQNAWAERLRANRPFVAEAGGAAVGFADLQDSGYIDQFFVAGSHAGRGVGGALMACLLQAALARSLEALWANVSLRAEPFFTRHGFVVEVRQVVERQGVPLRNARMRRRLAP
ncbi:MAG: family N-acetyltransferase [Rhodoferax sp.]|nr:family N-acetyltransferase [Rhodoferax sp.]